uniref:Uncharacterized protein n=1 Tax=Pristionchus pacificus TaxID=54126 RepID=A0A2A6C7U8_PRIPA|eukprot:PDM74123.1 hypothetical protein PRIPAC_41479 [Pristionchus pacificus]
MSSNLTLAEELLSIPTDGPDTSEPGPSPSEKWANLEDPLEGQSFPAPYELNYTIEELSFSNSTDSEREGFYNNFVHFLEANDWLLWAAVAAGVALIACVVIILTCWLYQHRKGVIHEKKAARAEGVQRQPSESNLENYKRPNMPPSPDENPSWVLLLMIQMGDTRPVAQADGRGFSKLEMEESGGSTTMTRGGFLSTDPSTHDLHFTNIETAADVTGPSKDMLCVYSCPIDGIPNNDLRSEQYRPLPTINHQTPVAHY